MNARWTAEDLIAFEQRMKKAGATVRTHLIEPKESNEGRKYTSRTRKAAVASGLKLSEAQVLRACLNILSRHPKVGFFWRQNTGVAVMDGTRKIKFSFRGCSDILGALKSGRFMAIETKATGKQPTPEQRSFLRRVEDGGGWAVCVDSPQALLNALEAA